MNEEQQVYQKPKPRWGLIASSCLGVFILGFILGLLFDAHFRPNYITLELDQQSHQIKVRPRKGDVINWVQRPAGGSPISAINVDTLEDSPCTNNPDKSICTIAVYGGQYTYFCFDLHGNSIPCDPGNDPQPNNDTFDLKKETKFGSVKVAFGADPGESLTTQAYQPVSLTPASGASGAAATNLVPAGIKCDGNNGPIVSTIPGYHTPPPPADITVTVGQTIQWTSGQRGFNIGSFLVGGNKTKICDEQTDANSVMDNDHDVCTVESSAIQSGATTRVPYTVTTMAVNGLQACPSTTTATAYLTVNPPPPAHP
jgi:plastocyanin